MNSCLVDTDIIIDYLKGIEKSRLFLKRIEAKEIEAFYSAITVAELFAGVRDGNEEKAVINLLGLMKIVEINFEISRLAGRLRFQYEKKNGIEIPDAIISATSLCLKIPLVTRNVKHFKVIREMELFDY